MCNVQHLVTNHTESQISQEWRAALPSPFTGGWLHMCSLKKKMHYSLTACQLYFLVPPSSFLAHLLALSHINGSVSDQLQWLSVGFFEPLFLRYRCHTGFKNGWCSHWEWDEGAGDSDQGVKLLTKMTVSFTLWSVSRWICLWGCMHGEWTSTVCFLAILS